MIFSDVFYHLKYLERQNFQLRKQFIHWNFSAKTFSEFINTPFKRDDRISLSKHFLEQSAYTFKRKGQTEVSLQSFFDFQMWVLLERLPLPIVSIRHSITRMKIYTNEPPLIVAVHVTVDRFWKVQYILIFVFSTRLFTLEE